LVKPSEQKPDRAEWWYQKWNGCVLPKTAFIGKCVKKEKRAKKNVTREVILTFVQTEQQIWAWFLHVHQLTA
jgi:hypothetical protein